MAVRDFPKVLISSLECWGDSSLSDEVIDEPLNDMNGAIFTVNHALNKKIYLWDGHILSVAVDVIVNSTNDTLNERIGQGADILMNGGQAFLNDINSLEGCRTGEAKITRSHSLPHNRYVIHAVGPKYNARYQTAAENALHSCYRTTFQLMLENDLHTIALPPINTPHRGYPKDQATSLALTTIRKFLEKFGDKITAIVFILESPEDMNLYRNSLRFYFPRTNKDIEDAKLSIRIEENISELGEKIIPEREIRISSFPSLLSAHSDLSSHNNSNDVGFSTPDLPISMLNAMEDHPDDVRKIELSKKSAKQKESEEIDRIFASYLKSSKNQDSALITRMNVVFQSDETVMGKPIVVFVGANFPPSDDIKMMKLLLSYIIRTLEAIPSDFVAIYFHAGMTKQQQPDFSWIQLLYKIWERKYSKRMSNLYIVHPTFWVKMILTLMKPFISKSFKSKMVFINSLSVLFSSIPSTLRIPDNVYVYDKQRNKNSNFEVDNPKNEGL